MNPISDINELLRLTLSEFDHPDTTVSSLARRALRIAALRRDYRNQLWLQWELTDLQPDSKKKINDPAINAAMRQLKTLLGAEEGEKESIRAYLRYEHNRQHTKDGETLLLANSVGQIEQNVRLSHKIYDDFEVPANLGPVSAHEATQAIINAKGAMISGIREKEEVLERIRNAIFSFLVATEIELDEGQQESQIFLRAQNFVNEALVRHAPTALKTFIAAQQSLSSGQVEDLSHALTSCRRMIKALADELYPATDDQIVGNDGVERKMSDDAYRNRLLQYAREKLTSRAHRAVIQEVLDSLGSRLKSLDTLANKGVHDNVSVSEAETCIVWTYLMAADILRIEDGTSSAFTREQKTVD